MQIKVTIDKSDVAAAVQAKVDEIKANAGPALYEGGQLLATACKEALTEAHGVKTGKLRGSIDVEQTDDTTVQVAPHTDYAYYVEVGHHTRGGGGFVPGKFYMKNGTEASRDQVAEYIRNRLTQS
jgi:phage gpG-like protein